MPKPPCPVETARPPRFLDDPCLRAPLSDPGGALALAIRAQNAVAFRHLNGVGSRNHKAFEAVSRGLQTPCVRFAAGVAPRTTQHSVPAGGQPSPGRTRTCKVAQKVSIMSNFLHDFPLHQALPGAIKNLSHFSSGGGPGH